MASTDNDAAQIALEYIKQIITLSAGILALSGTFIEKLVKTISYYTLLLPVAWILLLVSIYFGLETISTIVKSKLDQDENEWSKGHGLTCASTCKRCFVAGIAIFLLFVGWTLVAQVGISSAQAVQSRCAINSPTASSDSQTNPSKTAPISPIPTSSPPRSSKISKPPSPSSPKSLRK